MVLSTAWELIDGLYLNFGALDIRGKNKFSPPKIAVKINYCAVISPVIRRGKLLAQLFVDQIAIISVHRMAEISPVLEQICEEVVLLLPPLKRSH